MARSLTFMRIAASIFLLCCLPTLVSVISLDKLRLPRNAAGPEAMTFELRTGNFFTGVADGRILKYQGPTIGFVDFGYAAPTRSKSMCDGTDILKPNPICGRPLGMALHHRTKRLYVCDAFYGFGVLEPKGGFVTPLSTAAEGQPFRFCNAVYVHQPTGNVYFTDASSAFDITQFQTAVSVNDSTGRLLKYDVGSKQVTVLFRNLSFAAGVAVDKDEKFALVSEFIGNKTRKIWLHGHKPYESEIVNSLPTPDNIKRTRADDFWLAAARIDRRTESSLLPLGLRINGNGDVLQTVNLELWYGNNSVSEVEEFGFKLYIASRLVGKL
ncbi:putative Calcium-dependent phosphotriesterase superfamily protein [Hibiscus syriacus]|uniref:Putative Calcium-dependent phosphotriesterase superfamily protein n=1 Tax=Hibiscus syriacus TaxID=106335 RepID=A0A6A3BUG6_HIBSY|nr:protein STRICTOSIDINE SYNTHASE-LIKE 12-like [Hibiscus syriacus]KAE8720490.1 putative Calcium-dependent phosphotriesterase superfamily protein [Hibiscus syriacus]